MSNDPARVRSWAKANPEKVKASLKRWRDRNPEKLKKLSRAATLRKYGISEEKYQEMLMRQDHKCAICLTHQNDLTKTLHIDHCHSTGKVRGLLCSRCNRVLGLLKDDSGLLTSASRYLEDSHERQS